MIPKQPGRWTQQIRVLRRNSTYKINQTFSIIEIDNEIQQLNMFFSGCHDKKWLWIVDNFFVIHSSQSDQRQEWIPGVVLLLNYKYGHIIMS